MRRATGVDTVNGQATLYDPAPPLTAGGPIERDVCLGSGAHTHYFEQSQKKVASCIDMLVGA